jgi:uncharacterized protein YjiS (DUF1127 family)
METTDLTLSPRRSSNGALDIDHYRAHMNDVRAAAMRQALRDALSGLITLTRRAIAAIQAYRQRRAAYRELSALDAQALGDIGISRSDIDAVADGRFREDRSRCRKHYAMSLGNTEPVVPWLERARPGIRAAFAPCAD